MSKCLDAKTEKELRELQKKMILMNAHSDQILHRHFLSNNVCFNNREIMSKKMEENLNNYPEELEKMKELNKKAIQLGRDIRKQKEYFYCLFL